MTINELKINYDGVCIYASIILKPRTIGKVILSFFNLALILVVILFCFQKVVIGAVIFLIAEFFVLKYSLWNLYGEERLIINAKSISYQHHYGFFKTQLCTIPFNKRMTILPYDELVEGHQTYVKFLFETYDQNNLPQVIYQSVLHISKTDFDKLIRNTDQLFVDELSDSYDMPKLIMN